MARHALILLLVGAAVAAGCKAPSGRFGPIYARNVAQADYRDDVTGRRFTDRSRPVEVEIVRFAGLTGVFNARQYVKNDQVAQASGSANAQERIGSAPPREAVGLRLAMAGREVLAPAPVVGTQPPATADRGLAPRGMIGESSALRFSGWREAVVAEARSHLSAAAGKTPELQTLIQWPHGVHEIASDIALSAILLREDVATPRAPIVVLDFLTRFEQRPMLQLTKKADRDRAMVGEIITYTVTFFNDSPIEASNVVIADLVDEQCEYKADSQVCSRTATFAVEQTAEKRPVMVWRLKDPIGPHEAGTITYQLLVRKPWVR